MKLIDLVFESQEDELLAELKKAKKNLHLLADGHIMYRGVSSTWKITKELGNLPDGAYVYASEGRKEPRRSQTNTNFFLNLASEEESWKDIPARNMSVFATGHPSSAGDFGSIMIIVPFDSVKKFAAMNGDFNLKRIEFLGSGKLSIANLFVHLDNIVSGAGDWREAFKRMLDCKTPEDLITYLKRKDNSYFRQIVREIQSNDDLKELQALITNAEVFKVLKKNGLALSGHLMDMFDKNQVDAVGDLILAFEKDKNEKNKMLENLYEGIDQIEMLLYKCDRFLRDYGDFGNSLYDSIKSNITPERLGVKLFDSYADALQYSGDVGEIWFEGPYLLIQHQNISRMSYSKEFKDNEKIQDLLKKL